MTALKVLVVDDEAGVREMLHDVLVEWGCEVQICRDGRTTLDEYETGSAELALIDQNMPGLSGLELATRLRVGDPCLSIVMVTGWNRTTAWLLPIRRLWTKRPASPWSWTACAIFCAKASS